MGQTLSEPETQKTTSYGEDDRLLWAVSEMQGWRLCELNHRLSLSLHVTRRGGKSGGTLEHTVGVGWMRTGGYGKRRCLSVNWHGMDGAKLSDGQAIRYLR